MNSDEWQTPLELFNMINAATGNKIFWDACCNADNTLINQEHFIQGSLHHQHHESLYNYLTIDMQKVHRHAELMGYTPGDTIFMNPPYSNSLPFVKKAWEDSKYFRVIMLLKADPTPKWFKYGLERVVGLPYITHESVDDDFENVLNCGSAVIIYFLKDRVKFIRPDKEKATGAPFPSVLIVFDRRREPC